MDDACTRAEQLLFIIAQLRHAYQQLLRGEVKNQRAFARELIGPQIEKLEQLEAYAVDARRRALEEVLAEMTRLMQPQADGRYLDAAGTWNALLAFVREAGTEARR